MDPTAIASAASANAAQQTSSTASVMMLKKSMDIQQQSALSLLQALPQPVYNNPSNLGNSIDVRA